ncbi:uncharacterized protein AMSG_08408 [Thecamonas trahens ATCC 50062]|uniref:Uncharacterized protein n=1 Tax=Thecamonas trahens ATCC 50062 TaxID=461836 RepID=A0A0L0DJQ3_THETB|nr:hypothetical protein AMSG_08408 [Thecamonas trahens ATCC 50062]KNC52430.1 hypothetical protein AMSG_08408 [Thecamonas trahens ATCC 50062]|eukprot:XP_013755471.1 hypothetical protein AMSG_08408 [Thecamonas trahens ATCC 50062]
MVHAVAGLASPHLFVYEPTGSFPVAASDGPQTYAITAGDSLIISSSVFGIDCSPIVSPNTTHCSSIALNDGTCRLILAASLPVLASEQDFASATEPSLSTNWLFSTAGYAELNATFFRCVNGEIEVSSSEDHPSYAAVNRLHVLPKPSASVVASPLVVTVSGSVALQATGLSGGSPPYTLRWLLGAWSGPGDPAPGANPRTLALRSSVGGPVSDATALLVEADLDGSAAKAYSVSLVVRNAEGGVATGINSAQQVLVVPRANVSFAIYAPAAISAGVNASVVVFKTPGGGTGPDYALLVELIDLSSGAATFSAAQTVSTPDALPNHAFSTSFAIPLATAGAFDIRVTTTDSANVTVVATEVGNATLVVRPPPALLPLAIVARNITVSGNASAALCSIDTTSGVPPYNIGYALTRVSDGAVLASATTAASQITIPSLTMLASWLAPADTATLVALRCFGSDDSGVDTPDATHTFWIMPVPTITTLTIAPRAATHTSSLSVEFALTGGVPPYRLTVDADGVMLPVSVTLIAAAGPVAANAAVELSLLTLPTNVTICIVAIDASGVAGAACTPGAWVEISPRALSSVTATPVALTESSTLALSHTTSLGTLPYAGVATFYLAREAVWSSVATVVSSGPDSAVVMEAGHVGRVYAYADVIDSVGVGSLAAGIAGVAVDVAARPSVDSAALRFAPEFLDVNASLSVALAGGAVSGGTGSCATIALTLVDAGETTQVLALLGSVVSCDSAAAVLEGVILPPELHPASVRVAAVATDSTGVTSTAAATSAGVLVLLPAPNSAASVSSSQTVFGVDYDLFFFLVGLAVAGTCCCCAGVVAFVAWRRYVRRRDEYRRYLLSRKAEEEMAMAQTAATAAELSSSLESTVTIGFESSHLDSGSGTADLDELFRQTSGALQVARSRALLSTEHVSSDLSSTDASPLSDSGHR